MRRISIGKVIAGGTLALAMTLELQLAAGAEPQAARGACGAREA